MFIGEQPGNYEDLKGKPFVGPAGGLLSIPASASAARQTANSQETERRGDPCLSCLGSTAAQALLGPKFRVSTQRATFVESPLAPFVTATVHPSSILRAPTDERRHAEMARFIDDLKKIRKAIA